MSIVELIYRHFAMESVPDHLYLKIYIIQKMSDGNGKLRQIVAFNVMKQVYITLLPVQP